MCWRRATIRASVIRWSKELSGISIVVLHCYYCLERYQAKFNRFGWLKPRCKEIASMAQPPKRSLTWQQGHRILWLVVRASRGVAASFLPNTDNTFGLEASEHTRLQTYAVTIGLTDICCTYSTCFSPWKLHLRSCCWPVWPWHKEKHVSRQFHILLFFLVDKIESKPPN